ncbi:MAG: tRNA lysidine(34) synthetase TilS [Bacteroidales bacterium]|nr:tRNA lysidine(34) synthetase TilS [Bacteroidales bacterium]
MLQQFLAHTQQQHLFPTGQQVLLAVSGGVDSSVLAHLMYAAGYPFAIAHCNFALRPGDCDRDERFVRDMAERYHVPFHLARFDTLAYAHEHKLCIEDAARKLRYTFFEQVMSEQGYAAILTAHHRDDASETFFLNLLRGTGLAGLHGILPVQGHIVRPLLPFGRDEIERYAAEQGLAHVEDVTNSSLDYRRNQVRHQVMPLLRELQPAADRSLQQTMQHLQSVEQLYHALLQPLRSRLLTHHEDGSIRVRLSTPDALGLPERTLPQLFFELLRPYGFNMAEVSDILHASHPGRRFLSATHVAVLDRGMLLITPKEGLQEALPSFSFSLAPCPEGFNPRRLPRHTAVFDADTVVQPLRLRPWREGDRFQPLGMAHGTQLLSDYFSDHKFSLLDKQRQLLLVDAEDAILWIVGCRTDHPHRVTPQTHTILTVVIEQ